MLHKTRLISMVLVAITALLLTTSATPAQAAPYVERINSWTIDRIESDFDDCDLTIWQNDAPLHIFTTMDISWAPLGTPPSYLDMFIRDAQGRLIVYNILPQQGSGTIETEFRWIFLPNTVLDYVPARPWRITAFDDNGMGEQVGSIIFDPADYFPPCARLPYVGIQTGIDSDPIIDTSAQDTAIYNSQDDDGNPSLDVYGINDEGEGYYAFTITEADLASFADNPPEENTEIKSVNNVALYVLTTGEYQLNIGPDEEGKVRVVIFNGLPPTNVYSYDYNVYDILGE